MDLKHLKPDDLEYELEIRRIDPRKPDRLLQLQRLMREEAEGKMESPHNVPRLTRKNIPRELKECDAKLAEISLEIQSAIEAGDEGRANRAQTRLRHLAARVLRLQEFSANQADFNDLAERVNNCSEQVKTVRTSPGASCLEMQDLTDTLQEIAGLGITPFKGVSPTTPLYSTSMAEGPDPPMDQPINSQPHHQSMQPNAVAPTPSTAHQQQYQHLWQFPTPPGHNDRERPAEGTRVHNDFTGGQAAEQQRGQRRPQQHDGRPHDGRHSMRAPDNAGLVGGHRIYQWGMSFDGGANGLDASDFIFRVEQQARLYGVSPQALVLGFGNLLRDRAAQWYWTSQRQFGYVNWEDLKAAFIRRYSPHRDTDHDIRSKIESRKQQVGESFNDFCQDLEALAVRLVWRMSENELIEVLRRNMTMSLRKALWRERVYTVDELLICCNEYERLCLEEDRVEKRQRGMRVNEVSYDAMYGYDVHATYQGQGGDPVEQVEAIGGPGNRSDNIICWNCKDIGHSFAQCRVPQKTIFCFTCGMSGVLKAQCPK